MGYSGHVYREDVVIVPYRDGPYLVRGPVGLRDQDGRRIVATRRTIALCRCGNSRTRPFCDGTHRVIGFCAPSNVERPWREGDTRDSPPPDIPTRAEPDGSDHAPGPRAIAQAKLVRAHAKADALVTAPAAPPERQHALRMVQSLVAGARLLLAQAAAEQMPCQETPCLCLINEALHILASVPGAGQSQVRELVSLLTAALASLESQGSWP
jgi:CDGSH-type Zn-finger protein